MTVIVLGFQFIFRRPPLAQEQNSSPRMATCLTRIETFTYLQEKRGCQPFIDERQLPISNKNLLKGHLRKGRRCHA